MVIGDISDVLMIIRFIWCNLHSNIVHLSLRYGAIESLVISHIGSNRTSHGNLYTTFYSRIIILYTLGSALWLVGIINFTNIQTGQMGSIHNM